MIKGKVFRYLSAIILVLFGSLLVLLIGPEPSTSFGQLSTSLGFGFIVSGVASVFRELVILKPEVDETSEIIAKKTIELMNDNPIGTKGLKMVAEERRGFDGYYSWITAVGRRDLFFAGRSVLHRIHSDLALRDLGSAEKALENKLKDGSSITILFMDPRSSLIERLAKEEGQTNIELLSDIAFSVGVTKRLYELIKLTHWRPPAEIHIRVYDGVPNFAFHKEDNKVIVGFYFAKAIGSTSAAFEPIDNQTRQIFQNHFDTICYRANKTSLLELTSHSPTPKFNSSLYKELHSFLEDQLGKRKTENLINGTTDPSRDDAYA